MIVVVLLRLVWLAAEIRVQMILMGRLRHRYEVRGLRVLMCRRVVLVFVLMLVRVRMSMFVRMRMHQVAMLMRVLMRVRVIVRMLMNVHVAVLRWMVVIVRHDRFLPHPSLGTVIV